MLYYNEHLGCDLYKKDFHFGFQHLIFEKDTIIETFDKDKNHLVFYLKGEALVSCNQFVNVLTKEGEMIFLPRSSDCKGEAQTDVELIVLAFDNPVMLCDRVAMESLSPIASTIKYKFEPIELRPMVREFLKLLKKYLRDGLNCSSLHDIKQKELFLLMRTQYTKEECAQFFYHLIGKCLDFKSKVMTYYPRAKTAEELANLCGYERTTFQRLFKEHFGQSPYQWILKQMSNHIYGKLLDKTIPIKQIVEDFGFSSQAHFTLYCKKYFKNTPSEVRNAPIQIFFNPMDSANAL